MAGVSDSELCLLFTGDDESAAAPNVKLAFAICLRFRPASVRDLRVRLYGNIPPDEILLAERYALATAYADWFNAGRPLEAAA